MAEYFEWLEGYTVGVEEIDADHKILVDMLNRIVRPEPSPDGTAAVSETLDKLLDFAFYHFKHEEALMERTKYPHLAEHRAVHDRLTLDLVGIRSEFRNKAIDNVALANALVDWTMKHIVHDDTRFASHFHAHGIK